MKTKLGYAKTGTFSIANAPSAPDVPTRASGPLESPPTCIRAPATAAPVPTSVMRPAIRPRDGLGTAEVSGIGATSEPSTEAA